MGLQPSASRTDLLLECSYPFDPKHQLAPTQAGEPARYGSAFHEVIAKHIKRGKRGPSTKLSVWASAALEHYDLPAGLLDELVPHVAQAWPALDTWLRGKNSWKQDFTAGEVGVEKSYAWSPGREGSGGRRIAPPSAEDHHYSGLRGGEIAGTVDLIAHRDDGRLALVLDHKTGEDPHGAFAKPDRLPQLLTLVGGADVNCNSTHVVVAIFHARRRGLPIVHSEMVRDETWQAHGEKVRAALTRIGDGTMRPGPWCGYCPAREVCPAKDGELLEQASGLLRGLHAKGSESLLVQNGNAGLTRAQALGKLYDIVKKSEALASRARDEIRAEILRTNVMPELPDGKHLTVIDQTVERLSKSTLQRGLGKLAAEKEIARLRRLGGLEKSTHKQLHAEKE